MILRSSSSTTARIQVAGSLPPGAAATLLDDLRAIDRLECVAIRGRDITALELEDAWDRSPHRWAVWSHDVPVAFAGISSGCEGHLQSAGTPWFLTANGFRAAWRPFLRRLKPEFDAAKGCYSFLGNYVHEHNRLGIHLVNHLGFTLGDHLSIGFRRFWWWKESENNV